MRKAGFIFLLITILTASAANAQERLVGLHQNLKLAGQDGKRATIVPASTLLTLPFFDDFSNTSVSGVFPNQQRWEGKTVFINNAFATNMPTVGVASFDALDAVGLIHSGMGTLPIQADTLTSFPIGGLVAGDESVYLSFYFQAGGTADMPEPADSLILQFYSPIKDTWTTVWRASASAFDTTMTQLYLLTNDTVVSKPTELSSAFFYAQLQVRGADYLADGFSFRFINYASIAVNPFLPGKASTADHWNIDVVYLDKGRSAGDLLRDVAIKVPQMRLSKIYEAIPWTHYNNSSRAELFGAELLNDVTIINLGEFPSSVGVFYDILPLVGNGNPFGYRGGQHLIPAVGESATISLRMPAYTFYSDEPNKAEFRVRTYITTSGTNSATLNTLLRNNDTTTYIQRFGNHYAYDDGSAENGYGLYGNGTVGGGVAVKYRCYQSDLMQGVYIYFNRTINDANENIRFRLTVWNEGPDGKPDKILYSQGPTNPAFSDSIDNFVAYKFEKPVAIQANTNVFVGWINTSEDFINVGFDRNNDSSDKNYFSIGGTWKPSAYEGSIMIRPIFGKESDFPSNHIAPPAKPASVASKVVMSPVPTSDVLKLGWKNEESRPSQARVDIYDMYGKLVLSKQLDGESINVSNLSAGTYFVRIVSENHLVDSSKIIIAK